MESGSRAFRQKTENWQLTDFRFNSYHISYPKIYYQFIKEIFIYDVYNSRLLREGDIVLDVGATYGDFSVLASKKVGESGRVIALEPNLEDYQLLEMNIRRNGCNNVIPVNIGIGVRSEEREMSFWGRTFRCKMNTLENILETLNLTEPLNFVKMDIEGHELDILSTSINKIVESRVVSLELHNTKEKIDEILVPHGFKFYPVTTSHCISNMIRNTWSHPKHFLSGLRYTVAKNPRLLYKLFIGYDLNKNQSNIVTGSYIKGR